MYGSHARARSTGRPSVAGIIQAQRGFTGDGLEDQLRMMREPWMITAEKGGRATFGRPVNVTVAGRAEGLTATSPDGYWRVHASP